MKLVYVLIITFAVPFVSFGQNLAQHNWYFGSAPQKYGIRFNRADNLPTLVTNRATPFGPGGSAVATDPASADLYFYTDGNNVYDATHALMPGGAGLTSNSSGNQPVAVSAIPGQPNKYFIFTNSANFSTPGTVSYTVVDMTQSGNSLFPLPPLGAVDGTKKNLAITGLGGVSEGMIMIPHQNGTDFWLITQNVNTTTFNATLVNAASYGGAFITTSVTGIGKSAIIANFSYNAKLKKLLASPQNANTDIEILTFDNSGPAIPFGFDSSIPNSGVTSTTNQSVYDAQWDAKGQYIYFSRVGETGIQADLLQFDYTSPSTTIATILSTPVAASYGLQVGPDSAMYYLYQATAGGPFLVDKFTKTDTVAGFVIRQATPFGAGIDFKGTQFPSFLPKATVKLLVDFTFDALPNCQNTPTNFYPTVTPNADSLHWVFGDGKDTTQWSPIHTYTTAGTFAVTLSAYYQGQKKDTTKSVVITAFPLKLTLVSDTTACECQLPARKSKTAPCTLPDFSVKVKVTGGTATSYLWSNGETTDTVHPDSAGYYYVVVSDASGCSVYAGVNVKEFKLQDKRENIWYFGNKAGIDFNKTPAVALNTSVMDAPEGCSTMCDRNGQVIFYTDGSTVWDKNNLVIQTGIGGDPNSAQSAMIIPVPGDETLYYIFTTEAVDGSSQNQMKYSLYDLKQNKVVIFNQVLFSKSTEHLAGNANWVIAHEYGNNTFRAYRITAKGIGDPVYSSIGSDLSFQALENGQGYMKLGGKDNLAVTIATPGVSNKVELYDFVDSTGLIVNLRSIDLKTTAGNVYGVEFSSGGSKMFVSVDVPATPSLLYEYSIDSVGLTHQKKINVVNAELGAIQIAPDGQLYVATNDAANNSALGLIQANDDTTAISTFQLNGFALLGGTKQPAGTSEFQTVYL